MIKFLDPATSCGLDARSDPLINHTKPINAHPFYLVARPAGWGGLFPEQIDFVAAGMILCQLYFVQVNLQFAQFRSIEFIDDYFNRVKEHFARDSSVVAWNETELGKKAKLLQTLFYDVLTWGCIGHLSEDAAFAFENVNAFFMREGKRAA